MAADSDSARDRLHGFIQASVKHTRGQPRVFGWKGERVSLPVDGSIRS
jgi:hypothetical protein